MVALPQATPRFWGRVGDDLHAGTPGELRQDFRNFRFDRILAFEVLPETFPLEPGRMLADFLARMEAEGHGEKPAGEAGRALAATVA